MATSNSLCRAVSLTLHTLLVLASWPSITWHSLGHAAEAVAEAKRYLAEGVRAYHRGRINFQNDPLLRAKKYLAYSIELHPTAEAYFYMGGTLNLLGKYRTAIRAYLGCLEFDANVASVHQNLAHLFDTTENRSAAVTHYRKWVELSPDSAGARQALGTSLLWVGQLDEGMKRCDEAVDLVTDNPSIAYNCARMFVLFAPPEVLSVEESEGAAEFGDASSAHFVSRIEPHFKRAQLKAFENWKGGLQPVMGSSSETVVWEETLGPPCSHGARAVWQWQGHSGVEFDELSSGGEVYGQREPLTFGGAFTWAGQRYMERSVHIAVLKDVVVSGNEGVITRGCDVFVPYYDVQVPWHENLPTIKPLQTPARLLPVALWLLVMFPANFFSFLVDELARLAVWLTVREERIPLLVPADRGKLKPFMYDWFNLFGGFEVIPYDVRPHFTGADHVAEPRFVVRKLHVVDWRAPRGHEKRGDAFLLPPRWALLRLRGLAVASVMGASGLASKAAGQLIPETTAQEAFSGPGRTLVWIQRALANTRRVVNEDELITSLEHALSLHPGPPWDIRMFSDSPKVPTARETVRLFQTADIVVGVHGSGQANQIFCRRGTGIIDINLPEPHSQYTAHTSYALGLRYRLVMLQGASLHQTVNLTLPVRDIIDALDSLLQQS